MCGVHLHGHLYAEAGGGHWASSMAFFLFFMTGFLTESDIYSLS